MWLAARGVLLTWIMITPFASRLGALSLVVVGLVACGSAPTEHEEQSSTESPITDTPKSCPEYAAPLCSAGQSLRFVKDDDGCGKPECFSCPEYSAPICPRGRIVVEKDADGCGVPKCEAACPELSAPLCANVETVVIEQDANGCSVPKCGPKL